MRDIQRFCLILAEEDSDALELSEQPHQQRIEIPSNRSGSQNLALAITTVYGVPCRHEPASRMLPGTWGTAPPPQSAPPSRQGPRVTSLGKRGPHGGPPGKPGGRRCRHSATRRRGMLPVPLRVPRPHPTVPVVPGVRAVAAAHRGPRGRRAPGSLGTQGRRWGASRPRRGGTAPPPDGELRPRRGGPKASRGRPARRWGPPRHGPRWGARPAGRCPARPGPQGGPGGRTVPASRRRGRGGRERSVAPNVRPRRRWPRGVAGPGGGDAPPGGAGPQGRQRGPRRGRPAVRARASGGPPRRAQGAPRGPAGLVRGRRAAVGARGGGGGGRVVAPGRARGGGRWWRAAWGRTAPGPPPGRRGGGVSGAGRRCAGRATRGAPVAAAQRPGGRPCWGRPTRGVPGGSGGARVRASARPVARIGAHGAAPGHGSGRRGGAAAGSSLPGRVGTSSSAARPWGRVGRALVSRRPSRRLRGRAVPGGGGAPGAWARRGRPAPGASTACGPGCRRCNHSTARAARTALRRVKRRSVGQRLLLGSPHTRRQRKRRRAFCFHYLNGYGAGSHEGMSHAPLW